MISADTFSSHHKRYHTKPQQCPHCERSFGTVTHLRRHINVVHNTTVQFYCKVETCKFFRVDSQSKGFARKDNWRRHINTAHRMDANYLDVVKAGPEVQVDETAVQQAGMDIVIAGGEDADVN